VSKFESHTFPVPVRHFRLGKTEAKVLVPPASASQQSRAVAGRQTPMETQNLEIIRLTWTM
jgi:hypothetical protein